MKAESSVRKTWLDSPGVMDLKRGVCKEGWFDQVFDFQADHSNAAK